MVLYYYGKEGPKREMLIFTGPVLCHLFVIYSLQTDSWINNGLMSDVLCFNVTQRTKQIKKGM